MARRTKTMPPQRYGQSGKHLRETQGRTAASCRSRQGRQHGIGPFQVPAVGRGRP